MELFHAYNVEILNKAFIVGEDTKSSKTAEVHILDSHGKVVDTRLYAYFEKEAIYDRIAKGEIIDINNSYLKDFSLSEYRDLHKLEHNSYVEIKEFSAINAFLDADHEVDFSYSHFLGGSLNFINTVISCNELNFIRSKFDCEVEDFSNVKFNCNVVNFQYAKFGPGELHFKDAIFSSETISFINCNFNDGNEYFTGVDFGDASVAFQFAKFGEGDIFFEKTRFFGKRIDFSKVEFGKGRVDFRLAEFGDGDVSFDECEITSGKLRFRRATFGSGRLSFELAMLKDSEVSFERTVFGNGELSFYQCECRQVLFNSSHLNNYVDLRFSSCNHIDLSNTIVRDIVDFTNAKGMVNINEINFSHMRNLGRVFIDWYDNDVKRLIYNQSKTSVKMKAEQFRMLKEEFRALGQYTDEDKAYLEFKRLELKDRKIRTLRENKWNALWFYPMYWSEILIFDQIGHYATNPLRVLVSMIISFIAITFMYVILILTTSSDIVSSVGDPDKLPLFTKSIYHSAITFLTIGYGDYYPSGWIRWLSGIEGFVGLFLMSYFTVAFVRKVLR